jgi:hypothetical protein
MAVGGGGEDEDEDEDEEEYDTSVITRLRIWSAHHLLKHMEKHDTPHNTLGSPGSSEQGMAQGRIGGGEDEGRWRSDMDSTDFYLGEMVSRPPWLQANELMVNLDTARHFEQVWMQY